MRAVAPLVLVRRMKPLCPISFLLLMAACAAAAPAMVTGVQIVEFGTFRKTTNIGLMPAPKSITGMAHAVSGAELTEKTQKIHASKGISFGLRVKITGQPDGAIVQLACRCIHPKFTNPGSGRSSTVEEWISQPIIGRPAYIGYTFDNSWELVPGTWTMQVFYGATLVARKEFDVIASAQASNHASELAETQHTTSFSMASTPSPAAERASGLGNSSCSR